MSNSFLSAPTSSGSAFAERKQLPPFVQEP